MNYGNRLYRSPLALLIALLLAAEPALWGCSNSTDPEPTDDPVETASSAGLVDESAIGGEDLEVISVWDEAQAVDDNGEFDIVVSIEGTQLLMVQDESANVRGLALSMPSGQRGEFEDLRFDAASTLLGLLMMTPGILTVDPTEASARRDELQDLPEYGNALTLIEEQLPEHTIHDLLEMDSVNDALESCVRAWASRHGDRIYPPRFSERDSGFSVSIHGDSDPGSTQIQLANGAWRFLNVYRRDLSGQGQELGITEIADGLNSMVGAKTASWGSLFMQTAGSPSIESDVVDLSQESEIARSEYWATGLGWGSGSLILPEPMDGDFDDATVLTITWYLVFPLISLSLGSSQLLELGKEGVSMAWSVIGGLVDTTSISEASSPAEIATATVNVVVSIIAILAIAGATSGLLGISAPAWVIVGLILGVAGAGVSLANIYLAANSWLELPEVTMSAVYNETLLLDDFARIPAGSFTMGAPTDEPGSQSDERPQHSVALTRDFFIQVTEVTNQQYADLAQWAYDRGYCTVSGNTLRDALDGSYQVLSDMSIEYYEVSFDGTRFFVDEGRESYPVRATWFGAVAYCDWMSLQAGLPRAYNHGNWTCNENAPYIAMGYRLPTESEWEYACRAGSPTAFANGPITDLECDDPALDQIGWYCGNNWEGRTHQVGLKADNAWGLYDMHGNTWEWCNDWSGSYHETNLTDPVGPFSGTERMLRGGHYGADASWCRSANRHRWSPSGYLGFRPTRTAF